MADPDTSMQGATEPRFTNLARVRHTSTEFYLDFARLALDQPGVANLVSALVMTPQHAKALVEALRVNISKYEAKHGAIRAPKPPKDGSQ